MAVSYFSEQTPQEREGDGCGSEPTPLVPLVLCILGVGVGMALVQVSWASPLFGGTVLLVAAAAFRNGIEEAQEMAASEAQASPETLQEPACLDNKGQLKPPFLEPGRADRRFKGDGVWGLN